MSTKSSLAAGFPGTAPDSGQKARLQALRKILAEKKLDVFVCPTADAHQSEYVAECDKRRAFLSGFTGSAGTAVVTADAALLWTDGRYHLQAEAELTPDWKLMKDGLDGVPKIDEWLSALPKGTRIGVDPFVTQIAQWQGLTKQFKEKGLELVAVTPNPVDQIWKDRPATPAAPLIVLGEEFTGEKVQSKLCKLRGKLKEQDCEALVVSALDEIAWVFNLRGGDIPFNPVFMAYALITHNSATLYVDAKKVTPAVREHLGSDVTIKPYNAIFDDLRALSAAATSAFKYSVWMDPRRCNVALLHAVAEEERILERESPIALLKSVKNKVEIEGLRQAHIRDGVAMVKYLHWLENALNGPDADKLDEITVADRLEAFRKEQKNFVGLSFDTISGAGPNGAIIHYKAKEGSARKVTKNEMYLVDSGGQYLDGTTDITRTLHFGTPTAFEKKTYTLVLKGHIALATAVFPAGTPGSCLDVLARLPLWEVGLDYMHGTGHGVGAFLNVHEGPQGITFVQRGGGPLSVPLQPGMTVTNEPGYYHPGGFGIRIENIMVVCEAGTEHRFNDKPYYAFETITKCPIQTSLIDFSLMTEKEVNWLNAYHKSVYDALAPHLKDEPAVLEWLARATAPVSRN